jgi:hypothetical protein
MATAYIGLETSRTNLPLEREETRDELLHRLIQIEATHSILYPMLKSFDKIK